MRTARRGRGGRGAGALGAWGLLLLSAGTLPAQGPDTVRIRTVPVADGVYMLVGRGGNIGLSVGEDGVFVIDDQYAPLTERILAAIREITPEPVRFVVNTHWHGDHTGGNENMGRAGALLVAHENVRERLSVDQFLRRFGRVDTVPAAPPGALPVVTFTEAVTFHLNGDELHAFHVERAHTDGDAVIHFRRADVIHMGDVFFNGLYPFIDLSSGGSVDGVIGAVERVLEIAGPGTRVIPGHGPLSDREGLVRYRDMLRTVRDRVARAVAAGKPLEEVLAEAPTADFDPEWGGSSFMTPERFVGIVYRDLRSRGR